jgi:peptidoglycan/LPS O-acetylase OafA/YrhL
MFIFGGLLAKYHQHISKQIKNVNEWVIGVIGLVLYTSTPLINLFISEKFYVLNDWIISIGSMLIIIFSLNSNKAKGFLNYKPIRFCGDLSYSIYLYHLIILIALTNLLYQHVNIFMIYFLTLNGVLIVSILSWKFIEKPSIETGKSFSKFFIKNNKKRISA